MKIAMISTGTELLKGGTVNTNLAAFGAALTAAGIPLVFETASSDRPCDIAAALAATLDCADTIVISGGLGPTPDDVTLDTTAHYFGLELETLPELKLKVEEFWRRRHAGHCPKSQYRQARLPQGATIISNPEGSASGMEFSTVFGGVERHIFLTPGPPREFEPMVQNFLVPRLVELAGHSRRTTSGFLAAGVGEYALNRAVQPVFDRRNLEVGCTASAEGTRLFVAGDAADEVADTIEAARRAVGEAALPAGEFSLVHYLATELKRRALTLVTAESCTGGLISAQLTALPGVSEVYRGGAVVYSNALKIKVLGVSEALLAKFGAVSAPVARAMAEGACRELDSDCAVAVTGIAGPGGGTAEKPVGLVYIAAAVKGKIEVEELRLSGRRDAIRERSAARALLLLRRVLSDGGASC